ncbi:MAG: hypothetical protein A2W33_07670 [Chloroflexi bacterium RBG_16_52_11]|nr:MAG: hypothetical protein A2W33_07670 [Chloroflexi bacterium RBG_16_52_11]
MKEIDRESWWPSRYSVDDQRGSLNEITPEKIAAAARRVQRGEIYDPGRVLHTDLPRFEGRYWQQTLVRSSRIITGVDLMVSPMAGDRTASTGSLN